MLKRGVFAEEGKRGDAIVHKPDTDVFVIPRHGLSNEIHIRSTILHQEHFFASCFTHSCVRVLTLLYYNGKPVLRKGRVERKFHRMAICAILWTAENVPTQPFAKSEMSIFSFCWLG